MSEITFIKVVQAVDHLLRIAPQLLEYLIEQGYPRNRPCIICNQCIQTNLTCPDCNLCKLFAIQIDFKIRGRYPDEGYTTGSEDEDDAHWNEVD